MADSTLLIRLSSEPESLKRLSLALNMSNSSLVASFAWLSIVVNCVIVIFWSSANRVNCRRLLGRSSAGVDGEGIPPNVPKRKEAGASGTSLLYASVGSMMLVGRVDRLGTLGVLAGVCAGVLAGVVKAAVSVSNEGIEEDDEELGVAGTAAAGAGGGADALAVGVS